MKESKIKVGDLVKVGDIVVLDYKRFSWKSLILWDGPFESNVSYVETVDEGEPAIVTNIHDVHVEILSVRGLRGWVQSNRVRKI